MSLPKDSYSHGFRFRWIRIATDNVAGQVIQPEFDPTPPIEEGYFLLLDGTHFMLLNGQDLTLL